MEANINRIKCRDFVEKSIILIKEEVIGIVRNNGDEEKVFNAIAKINTQLDALYDLTMDFSDEIIALRLELNRLENENRNLCDTVSTFNHILDGNEALAKAVETEAAKYSSKKNNGERK